MRSDIRLGKIAGIPIGLSWSLLLIGALLTWALATSLLPAQVPGFSTVAYVAAAVIGAALFFGSVLLHEVGHALVARHYEMRVESITLWLLGGVARMRDEAPHPRAELLMAAAGPGVSFLLAGLFGVVGFAVSAISVTPTTAVFGWLAFVNAALAIFNLMPGAPLDGGRVLRAILWRVRGDRDRAGVGAARVGRYLGFALGALGALLTFATGSLGGIWFVLIGLFIVAAAGAEQAYYKMRVGLRDARVRDALPGVRAVVPGWFTIDDAIAGGYMPSQWHSVAVEAYTGGVQGVLTSAGVTSVPLDARARTRVQDVAVPRDATVECALDDRLSDVLMRLTESQSGFAIVVEDDEPIAALGINDINRIAEHWEEARARPTRPAGEAPGSEPASNSIA